jgi:hypothetical protein
MKTPVLVLILTVVAAALPSGAPSAQDYAIHTFKCPNLTSLKLNWPNKIETQPTDFPIAPNFDNQTWHPQFKESAVNVDANTVQCLYSLAPATYLQAPYIYKVHRKIISCTGQPGPTIECRLQKN